MSFIDRWFIKLIAGDYHFYVQRSILQRSPIHLIYHLNSSRFHLFIRNVAYIIRIVRCLFLPRQNVLQDSYYVYTNQTDSSSLEELKFAYNSYINDSEKIYFLTNKDTKFASRPNYFEIITTLIQIIGITFISLFKSMARLTPHYAQIYFLCLLVKSYAQTTNKPIHIPAANSDVIVFLSAYLKKKNHKVIWSSGLQAIGKSHPVLICDKLLAINKYQLDEFTYYKQFGVCKSCEYWPRITLKYSAEELNKFKQMNHSHVVGVYTTGFWLRKKQQTIEAHTASQGEDTENQLLLCIYQWVNSSSNAELIIFPHPSERSHFRLTGEHQFERFASHDRIQVDLLGDESNSMVQSDRVGLGIVGASNSGFHRIELGLKTLIYSLDWHPDMKLPNPNIDSIYNQIFIKDQNKMINAIDQVRCISHKEFMNSFFAGDLNL